MSEPDPYQICPDGCTHNLGHGVLVDELLATDGPYPPTRRSRTPAGALVALLRAGRASRALDGPPRDD